MAKPQAEFLGHQVRQNSSFFFKEFYSNGFISEDELFPTASYFTKMK